jgi:hypothetical protein
VATEATEALHAIRFGTPPLRKGELEAVTQALEQWRQIAGDFTADGGGK